MIILFNNCFFFNIYTLIKNKRVEDSIMYEDYKPKLSLYLPTNLSGIFRLAVYLPGNGSFLPIIFFKPVVSLHPFIY